MNSLPISTCPCEIVIPVNCTFGYFSPRYIEVPPTPQPASNIFSDLFSYNFKSSPIKSFIL